MPPRVCSLQVMRLPLIISKAQVDARAPKEQEYALRCDLYDGADIPCGAMEGVFVIVSPRAFHRCTVR